MVEQIKNGFKQVVMSEECKQRIESAMLKNLQETQQTRQSNRFIPRRVVVAAVAIVALMIVGEGTVYACTGKGIINHVTSFAQNAFCIQSIDDNGVQKSVTSFDTSGATAPAEYSDGKLFFTASGDRIDITDEVSDTAYYVYTYVDDESTMHYIIIGGKPKTFGYAEFIKDASETWVVGYYKGGVVGEDINPAWLENAKKNLNISWL